MRLPDSLLIGVSTAAVQIEGGDTNNNWFQWAQRPGTIVDGSSPIRSTGHWDRWHQDTELLTALGIQTYRMGLEWSRIEPRQGEFDRAAIARYRQEIAALRQRGIIPLVTLHHFTNPLWFQKRGEWTDAGSVEIWLAYVRRVVMELADLVTDWVTINEPNVYAALCHLLKVGPPGTSSPKAVRAVMRHMSIAHVRAYRLIHEIQPEAKVGIAHHLRVFDPLNPRNPVHRALARVNEYLFQTAITDAMLGGRFPKILGPQPADILPGKYYDYLGINYYTRTAVSKLGDGSFPGRPVNDLGWEIYPEGLERVARWLHERYPGPIWITENGTCDNGDPETGQVERFRIAYLEDHLGVIAASKLPFERYYHWCFVDNWEWAEGETARFGIVHNDFETQTRTVKPSGEWLARLIRERTTDVE